MVESTLLFAAVRCVLLFPSGFIAIAFANWLLLPSALCKPSKHGHRTEANHSWLRGVVPQGFVIPGSHESFLSDGLLLRAVIVVIHLLLGLVLCLAFDSVSILFSMAFMQSWMEATCQNSMEAVFPVRFRSHGPIAAIVPKLSVHSGNWHSHSVNHFGSA